MLQAAGTVAPAREPASVRGMSRTREAKIMRKKRTIAISVVVLCIVGLFDARTFAQAIAPAQTALEAARAGAVRSRSPGRMVGAGVAAALTAADVARAGVVITETSRRSSRLSLLIADTVADLFDQLNLLIVAFDVLMQQRAGGSPSVGDLLQGAADLDTTGDRIPGRR